MRPLKFLIVCFLGFFLLAGAYALLIDKLVIPDRAVPLPFRQFLLEASSKITPKVIIDSGSNSNYGIDTFLLSNYFQAPVIVIADHGGYPLRNKIFRLKRYVSEGDVLILPLEWSYYSNTEKLTDIFLASVADENLSLEYYFNELPLNEKIQFIFTKYPLELARTSLVYRSPDHVAKKNLKSLALFENTLKARDNTSFGQNITEHKEIAEAAASRSCDEYLSSGTRPPGNFEISSVFRSNLALLEDLSKSGITIYFTWPVMVDSAFSQCLSDPRAKKKMQQFSLEIRQLVEKSGIKFIGNIEDSQFTSRCFLNTYYHLRYSCSKERTTRLVESMERYNVPPINSPYSQEDLLEEVVAFAKETRKSLTK